MPRSARKISRTGIYHVMLRGINQQDIFEDEEDYRHFLSVVRECKKIGGFEIYAYCLMTNHIHLLIKEGAEPLELVFKRIGCRFVYWYNLKYQRVGHLFQDRYKSETVEGDASFLKVLRYIIQNPMKAGMETGPGNYPWSSFHSYLGENDHITDVGLPLKMFPSSEDLIAFLNQTNDDCPMDISKKPKGLTDDQACEIMREITDCSSVPEFQLLDKKLQKEYAAKLRERKLSLNQIVRLTGMSKATIYRSAG